MIAPALVLHAVDLAIAVLVVEALVLFALRARHRLPRRDIVLIALAGLGLLAALRTGLAGGPGVVVLACLTLGGLAHGLDLALRLRLARSVAQKR
jgi:fatty acid desaturase